MQIRTLDDGRAVWRVAGAEAAAAVRPAFVALYTDVVRDPPYEEVVTAEDAGALWDRLTASGDGIVLVVASGSDPADGIDGFAIAVPLAAMPAVARELGGLVPARHTMYLAELGVRPAADAAALRLRLNRLRLAHIDEDRFSHVVLRAPVAMTDTIALYRDLGFTDMGVSMEVVRPRVDGSVRGDERAFMSRVRSLVAVDPD